MDEASANPDICVAIPTYRREEVLLDTIREVLAQTHRNLELLVVDQSPTRSSDMEQQLRAIKDPRFRYYLADPPSLPAARNFCLKAARAPIVLFLDDDVKLKKDMVAQHLAAFKTHPGVSAVGGRVLQAGFPVQPDVLRFDDFAVSHGVFTATKAAYTNAFPGGNHAIKVTDALALGGYDTRYYYSAFREESDMSLKLTRAGKKIWYEPRAELLHLAAHAGGTRAHKTYTHIYDSRNFYQNELFFTLRNAKHRLRALKRKYHEYCSVDAHRIWLRRSAYFYMGLAAALWRLAFGKQTVTRERES